MQSIMSSILIPPVSENKMNGKYIKTDTIEQINDTIRRNNIEIKEDIKESE